MNILMMLTLTNLPPLVVLMEMNLMYNATCHLLIIANMTTTRSIFIFIVISLEVIAAMMP